MAAKPVRRDAETAAFFDGTAQGQFLLLHDTQTGEILDPRTEHLLGSGTVRARAGYREGDRRLVVRPHTRLPDGGTLRTVVGIVQLEEGPWWWSELRGFDPDEDLAGAPVQVAFEPSGSHPEDESISYLTEP